MKINELFPSKYMKGADLAGKPWSFKIAAVRLEEMHDKQTNSKAKKPVVHFFGPRKGLILNQTLAQQIARAIGQDDTDNWPGHSVTIYPTTVHAFGADHLVIRAGRTLATMPSEAPDALVHDDDELAELDEENLA